MLIRLSDAQTIRNFTELCSLSWVWVLAKKYRTVRYKVGLSDTSDYLKFLRTSLSVLNCFYSSWVIFKSDYPMWSEYPMTQRLRNSMELESLWEDEILGSKITEYPIWHRTIRSIGLSEILQNFVLCLWPAWGSKTSDYPMSPRTFRGGMKRFSPNGHILGASINTPHLTLF